MPSQKRIMEKMEQLAQRLCYHYEDLTHLARAMYSEKEPGRNNYTNDEMATLGDAVLKLVWSEHFFDLGYDKDRITDEKANLENNATLKKLCDLVGAADFAYNDEYFAFEAPAHRRLPNKEHDFYIEAIIAAIYKDLGLEKARRWILEFWGAHPEAIVTVKRKKAPERGGKEG